MFTVAVITARWQSHRLPGKALIDINGRPMLRHIIDRCLMSAVDEVCVATTKSSKPIIDYLDAEGLEYAIGSEEDILSRLALAAKQFDASHIVRVWGDSPLINPRNINRLIGNKDKAKYLYLPDEPLGTSATILEVDQLYEDDKCRWDGNDRHWYHAYCIEQSWAKPLRSQYDLSGFNFSVDDEKSLYLARSLCIQ